MRPHSPEFRDTETVTEPQAFSFARIFLGLMLLWAPLPFGAVYAWAWASITILALLILILWMAGSLQAERLSIWFTPLYIPIVLFLLLGVAQVLFHLTLTPVATKESFLKLATYSVLYFVVTQLFVDAPSETWRRMGLAVLIFGFTFSFLSILQFLWDPNRILWVGHNLATPFGPYVDHDHYAGLMELVIPISASYMLSRPKHDPLNVILWLGVLIPILSSLLTGSRGGFVSLLVEIGIVAWIMIWQSPLPGRRIRVAMSGLGLVAVAGVFLWLGSAYVFTRLVSVNNYVPDATPGNRLALWEGALGIVRSHPLVGAGMGSFVTVYPSYQTDASDLVTEHAHNDYVEALTETGFVGAVLILAALILLVWSAFRKLSAQSKRSTGWIQLGAVIACCGFLVHSFVDFNLHIPANAAWFAFCIGLASLSGRATSRRSESLA